LHNGNIITVYIEINIYNIIITMDPAIQSTSKAKYKCENCDFSSKYIHIVERHKTRKIACNAPKIYECEHCKQIYTRGTTLRRHQATSNCKDVNPVANTTTINNDNHSMNITNTSAPAIIGDKNTITTTDNSVHFHLNAFGSENYDYIKLEEYAHILRNGNMDCISEFLKKVHFDMEHPENHNAHIPSKKSPKLMLIWDGTTWEFCDFKVATDKLIMKSETHLKKLYKKLEIKFHMLEALVRSKRYTEEFEDGGVLYDCDYENKYKHMINSMFAVFYGRKKFMKAAMAKVKAKANAKK
jgi:hypothetical protein